MSDQNDSAANGSGSQVLFWGCFIALITTAFGFVGRMFLVDTWSEEFDLDAQQGGMLLGIGIWPFAVSIILFSLVIDYVGYKRSMVFAFVCHLIWAVMGVSAYFVTHGGEGFVPTADDKAFAYNLLFWGSLILALGNGTVEAFINPVVATMFSKEKTKWLNILHAGWPGGLVVTGIIVIFMAETPWAYKVGIIAIPTLIYGVMLIGAKFPVQERVSAGVSYREMLQEFGILGAIIVAVLFVLQLMAYFPGVNQWVFIGLGIAMVVAFGAYTQALGRPFMFFMTVIMMPLAVTEIGTDGWIENILKGIAADNKFDSGWVLVYTAAIMLVLRFFAGPIVHSLSPLGLLAVSAVLAIAGLYWLSFATGMVIFGAATLYGIGKTFFWPTMLGVVTEQSPKGGALTLNAISGIGMLAVGTIGFPFIGLLQVEKENAAIVANEEIQAEIPGLVVNGEISVLADQTSIVGSYKAIDDARLEEVIDQLPEAQREGVGAKIKDIRGRSSQGALATMALFPTFMLVCYLILIFYFKSRGGYKPIDLSQSEG